MFGIPILFAAGLEMASPLSALGWGLLAIVPAGIVALYFLKLRRKPVRVPSTLLWRRSLEDIHVNSLFQRLRRNLLLFLQLLAVGLAMLALLGLKSQGLERQGRRLVLAIDESASMGATDVEPTRLDAAKAEALKVVEAMGSGDLAMVVAFSDRARVVASYTGDRDMLRRRIEAIRPTDSSTSLREALQLVAGLANPQRYMEPGEGVIAAEVAPPKLFLFTDGGFPDVEGFSLGNIQPEVVVIGPPPPPYEPPAAGGAPTPAPASDNLAIVALEAVRDKVSPDQTHVFGRVKNYRAEPASPRVELYRRDPSDPDLAVVIDAIDLQLDARGEQGFEFDLAEAEAGDVEARLDTTDSLPLDDRAFATFASPRKAQVLFVTPGNRFLDNALETRAAVEAAEITRVAPEAAKEGDVARDLAAGRYDLVILDRARLDAPPEANTLSIGILPGNLAELPSQDVEYPVLLNWDNTHPLLQYVTDLNLVAMKRAEAVEVPRGARDLIQGGQGSLAFSSPRGSYVDAVLTFPILGDDGQENTNWPLLSSFPLFVYNALQYLGHADEATGGRPLAPGDPAPIRPETPVDAMTVRGPTGSDTRLEPAPHGGFVFNAADRTGLYRATWGEDGRHDFAVNLFDPRESDLAPRGQLPAGVPDDLADSYRIKIGYNPVQAVALDAPATFEWWWPLTLLALGILLVEWYVYNRRVYV